MAPQPVNISNCGTIIVRKVTVPSPDPTDTSFSYTAGGGLSPTSFSLKNGGSRTYQNVPAKSGYSVAETVPTNWQLTSATCDDGSPVSNIDVSPNEVVTCTFTNTLQTGGIKVTKTRKHAADGPGDHPQSGVSFTVNGVTKQTYANGNDKSVTIDNSAGCGDATYVGENVSFHNTPLTDITVSVDSQVTGGTSSTITCKASDNSTVASGSTGADGDGSTTASDLEPDTYTCTVVVDPESELIHNL